MKHLKKFFESSDQDIDILKEYFFNITDDLEDICNFNLKQNTSSYYTITITSTLDLPDIISQENANGINRWIKYNGNDSRILQELKSSISRLQSEDIIESFSLTKMSDGYELSIYTKIKEGEDVSNWISVDDSYVAWIDESRLRKYLKDKFGVNMSSAKLQEEYTKYNERYIELEIRFKNRLSKNKLEQIESDLLKMIVTTDDEDELEIFSECYHGRGEDTFNWMSFVLDSSIVDFE